MELRKSFIMHDVYAQCAYFGMGFKEIFFLQISQMCITYEKKNIGPEIFGMVKQ